MFGKRVQGDTRDAPRVRAPARRGRRRGRPSPRGRRRWALAPTGAGLGAAPAADRKSGVSAAGPRSTPAYEQLRAAQALPVAEIVHQQSDYYHATKTTIFNALINTIDLSQLGQLEAKAAAQEIRDIVAELVAIKNVSMSVAEQDSLVQDIINDVLGYGPLEAAAGPRRHRRHHGQRRPSGCSSKSAAGCS